MRTIIHVNQHEIKKNRADPEGPMRPVLTCKTYKENRYGHEAIIRVCGREVGRFVYRPDKPLSCGAHVWFETEEEVDVKVEVEGI